MAKKKSPAKRKIGILSILVLGLNVLAVVFLLLAYLAVHVSPAKNWILPFFGLAYPYLLLINVAFVIFWAISRKWFLLMSLVAIILGWNHMGRIFRLSGSHIFEDGIKYVKVTSYNVKNLSNDNVDLLDHNVRSNIINYLDRTGSDIICLQELMIIHKDPDSFIDSLSTILGLPYHSYTLYSEEQKRFLDAIFIFSRFPIINSGQLESDSQHNYAIYSDIVTGADTFRLFNVHMESIRLKHEDYSFISNLDLQFEKDENIKENSLRIFRKLKNAFAKRSFQANQLAEEIDASPFPVVLCGDFNDTPNSYTYQQLSAGLTDSFMASGSGFGNSYIGKLPSFRIDYILYDENFQSTEFKRDLVRFSDHFPISCYLGLR